METQDSEKPGFISKLQCFNLTSLNPLNEGTQPLLGLHGVFLVLSLQVSHPGPQSVSGKSAQSVPLPWTHVQPGDTSKDQWFSDISCTSKSPRGLEQPWLGPTCKGPNSVGLGPRICEANKFPGAAWGTHLEDHCQDNLSHTGVVRFA